MREFKLTRSEQTAFEAAFKRVSASDSHYWGFLKLAELASKDAHTVEVRLNLPDGDEVAVKQLPGWSIAHRKPGMLFLRRRQPLDEASVKLLFKDALRLAIPRGWQFHSWQHEPNLPDW